eukprot:scaffold1913_cov257-Pinguiococcus_pyrenoidosus.AAC.7
MFGDVPERGVRQGTWRQVRQMRHCPRMIRRRTTSFHAAALPLRGGAIISPNVNLTDPTRILGRAVDAIGRRRCAGLGRRHRAPRGLRNRPMGDVKQGLRAGQAHFGHAGTSVDPGCRRSVPRGIDAGVQHVDALRRRASAPITRQSN